MSERVTIARFYNVHEAQLAQMKLEAHGVEAYVMNEFGSAMTSLYNAAPTIPLEVNSADAERAQQILNDVEVDEGGAPYREPAIADHHDEVHPAGTDADRAWKNEAAADADAARAFRGAVLGFFLCPGIVHVYVLWQLRKFKPARASAKGKRHAMLARLISYAVLALIPIVYFVRQSELDAERAASCAQCRKEARSGTHAVDSVDTTCARYCDPR